MLLERIRKCPHCKRENTVSPQSYAENPYCNACYPERVKTAQAGLEPATIKRRGDYFEFIPVTQRLS